MACRRGNTGFILSLEFHYRHIGYEKEMTVYTFFYVILVSQNNFLTFHKYVEYVNTYFIEIFSVQIIHGGITNTKFKYS